MIYGKFGALFMPAYICGGGDAMLVESEERSSNGISAAELKILYCVNA